MVKRTGPGKNRINSDTIEFFSRGSMHGFGFQIQWKQFFVKLQSAVFNSCHLTSFSFLINIKKNEKSLQIFLSNHHGKTTE